MADRENDVPASADTVYRMASISKPITAVAIMQLVEQGKVDLEAPIQRYVPSFPENPYTITVRHLLSHQSGIRDFDEQEARNQTHYPYGTTPQTVFLDHFKDSPLLHEPGSKFRYTTHGYNLLGCVIEQTSGIDYLSYVRNNIFAPAGMAHTYPDDAHTIIAHRARGYVRGEHDADVRNADFVDTSDHLPGGGFCSNVQDVVRFGTALESGRLLHSETFAQMLLAQKTTTGQNTRFGLGWFVWQRRGETEAAHGGKHYGTSTMLLIRSGIVVGLMTNLQGVPSPSLIGLAKRLADILDEPEKFKKTGTVTALF